MMCCDICPYYDECEELNKLQEDCCSECPDYFDCKGKDQDDEEFEDNDEINEFIE